jgi:hypothetical protein
MAINQGMVMKALEWGYDKAITGVPGFDSAEELAASYSRLGGTTIEQSNALIRWQIAKAGTSGFIAGLGGLVMLPVAIPANISSVFYVQLRMIAGIAHLGGYNVRDDQVRTLAYLCLCGSLAADVAKDLGIQLGVKLTEAAIRRISGETLYRINQKIGFTLVTKFGERGVINLGKALPLVGGLIGGTFDGVATHAIGNVARRTFVDVA